MVKEIVTDMFMLRQKSEKAERKDLPVAKDLLDTLKAHDFECVGMAANMIGVSKTILAASLSGKYVVMINPEIVSKSEEMYETEEGCLSLSGKRKVRRYSKITVEYLDMKFRKKRGTYSGFDAEIIQHEIDHFSGILI